MLTTAGAPDSGISCTPPMVSCDDAYCADTMTDKANCGGCHLQCAATEFCNAGVCQPG